MEAYLRNAWYVAGWVDEVTDQPLGRRLLDEPVVFYRRSDGRVAALHDRCPHRFVPLSRGRVSGDNIQCGYHGLCFDGSGNCVDERANDLVRDAAKLRSYPVEERFGIIWIWMGTQDADVSLIPDCSFLQNPKYVTIFDQTHVKANYKLEIDNLMDLSHLDYVHLATISNGSLTHGDFKTWQDDAGVYATWWTEDCPIPRQFVPAMPGAERVDQWADVTWTSPCNIYINSGATRCNQPREEGYWIEHSHFLTPETATTTHYFWAVARPEKGSTPEGLELMKKRLRVAFVSEDAAMIEVQQATMKSTDFWSEKPIVLAEDAGAIRARRTLEKLIRTEQEEASKVFAST